MVGYQKYDTLTPNQKLVAGCVAGVITRFITQPMDVIKLRVQLQKKPIQDKKWFKISRQVLNEEGLLAFYQGHNLGQIHSIIAVSSQFYIYELTTRFVAQNVDNSHHRHLYNFICGLFSGCTSAALVMPLEVVRVRQMIGTGEYRGLMNGAKLVYRSGGFSAFYSGLTASLLQMGPTVGISFGVFKLVQPMLLQNMEHCDEEKDCQKKAGNIHRPESLLLASTVAGSAAGFVSKSVTYPLDLIKRRLQVATHIQTNLEGKKTGKELIKCTSIPECFIQAVRKEGLRGLFRGWKVTIYKAQLTSVVAYTSYEMLCYLFREISYSQSVK